MAMFVSTRKSEYVETVYVQTTHISSNPNFVIGVQADGHELDRCLSLLGMTRPTREDGKSLRVVLFYGDQAKFIVGNW